jgi:hypothetical protein
MNIKTEGSIKNRFLKNAKQETVILKILGLTLETAMEHTKQIDPRSKTEVIMFPTAAIQTLQNVLSQYESLLEIVCELPLDDLMESADEEDSKLNSGVQL